MISEVLRLFKGESPQVISGGVPDKVQSLKKIQTVLHLTRAILLLLGVALVTLGVIGVIGSPGLVAGGVLLSVACGLIVPLCIRGIKKIIQTKHSEVKQPIVELKDPSLKKEDQEIFTQTWNEFESMRQKWEKMAREDPKISAIWVRLNKRANDAVYQCDLEELSEEFYLPLLFWGVAEEMNDKESLPAELSADWALIEIQSYYLLVMQGLQHFDKLMMISSKKAQRYIEEDRRKYGDEFSIESIVLCLARRRFGMQVIRAGLAQLYQCYVTIRQSVGRTAAIDKVRPLYNDVIKQCNKKFLLKEIEKLVKLKQQRGAEICHGDLIYKMLSQLDKGSRFPALNLANPHIGRGSNYDCLWG